MTVEPLTEDLSGRVLAASVGGVQLRRIRASAHRFDRIPSLIRRSDEDYYKIALGIGGSSLLVQDGRGRLLSHGKLASKGGGHVVLPQGG